MSFRIDAVSVTTATAIRRILSQLISIFGQNALPGEWDIYIPVRRGSIPEDCFRGHYVMRRKYKGVWQFRAPTEEELSLYDAERAW